MERKLIAVAVSSALALPMAAQAVEFSAYGQVTRAIISVDDGSGDDSNGDLQHVEGAASPSRFGFRGSEELESGMTVGVNAEWSADSVSTRQSHLYLSTAGGTLTAGHASTATDGMAHADLSGGPSFLGGATPYCAWAGDGVACPTNDGGRRSVLKYSTPSIGPASIVISTGGDDYWDAMLKISGSMGDSGYDLRIGHIGEYDTTKDVARMPATTASESVMGSALLELLRKENPSAAENANNDNPFFNNSGEPEATVTTADAEDAVDAHVEGADDVLALYQVGSATNVGESTYRKVTHVPEVAATTEPDTAGDITTASAAFSFGQGTSVAVAWSQDNLKDHEYQYVKLDHSYADGASVAVYYKTGEQGDTDGSMFGVALGHTIGGGAVAFAGYRRLSEDNAEDVDLIVAGLRVTFN